MKSYPWDHGRIVATPNGRRLMHEDGTPFFWLGDTAWELFHRLDFEETEDYLDSRAGWGVNVVQAVALAELDGVRIPNRYGDLPLEDEDPTRLNEPYWNHLDEVVGAAAERGIYIGLLPTWGDKINQDWGLGPVIFDERNARIYGELVARRLAHRANVIWIVGGDREPKDRLPVYRTMAEGLHAAGPRRLTTFHPCGGRSSAADVHAEPWLDLDMQQSGHGERTERPHRMMAEDWARVPAKPVLDGEPRYEGHIPFHGPQECHMDGDDARRAAYLGVFAGGCGVTYGCHAIWQARTAANVPINRPQGTWRESLDLPGIRYYGLLRGLMESLPFNDMLPDADFLVAPADAESAFAVPMSLATADRSTAAVYLPFGGEAAIAAPGPWEYRLFNPRNGSRSGWRTAEGGRLASYGGTSAGNDFVALVRRASA